MSYPDYLRSSRWARIRARVLKRDRRRCRSCGARATEVHHASYDRATMLGADDRALFSLCRDCHEATTFSVLGIKRAPNEVRRWALALKEGGLKAPRKPKDRKRSAKRKRLTLEEIRLASLEYASRPCGR